MFSKKSKTLILLGFFDIEDIHFYQLVEVEIDGFLRYAFEGIDPKSLVESFESLLLKSSSDDIQIAFIFFFCAVLKKLILLNSGPYSC